MMHNVALLLGFLGVPVLLVAMGHHLRRRARRTKYLFWGGVIGHSLGMAAAVSAMLLPPVFWGTEGEGALRTLFVHWSMLVACMAGMALAALWKGEARHEPS